MTDDPEPTRADILAAARLAGLDLPQAYEDDLVEAYGHVRRLVRMLPSPRGYRDEPAHVFDPARFLPPPRDGRDG